MKKTELKIRTTSSQSFKLRMNNAMKKKIMGKCLNRKDAYLSLILICTIILTFFGCAAPTNFLIIRQTPTGIDEGDKIAVLINSKPYFQSSPIEKKICKCLKKRFNKLNKKIEIVSSEEFRNVSFANIKLPGESTTQRAINHLFSDKKNAKQNQHMSIRYIVLVDEPVTSRSSSVTENVEWTASAGMPVPILTIAATTAVDISIFGSIYDFKRHCKSGEIRSSTSGESIFFVSPPIVFGWPSGVSLSQACENFSNEVAEFIIGHETESYSVTVDKKPVIEYQEEEE